MKKFMMLLFTVPLAVTLSLPAFGQSAAGHGRHYTEHGYYGNISDSNCGAHHKMAGHARACTLGCIKHGAKYVFVTDRGKVLMIANQKMPELEKFAGEHVHIMGKRTEGGKAITISSMRAAHHRTRKAKAKA